jgi:hypothetical protein
MPTSTQILERLAAISRDAQVLAIVWHALIAAVVLQTVRGWRPTRRLAMAMMLTPLITVVGLAFTHGLVVNWVVLGVGLAALTVVAADTPKGHVVEAPTLGLLIGAGLVAFGWCYPHFVSGAAVLYAAPVGLVPCPTLAVLIGATIAGGGLRSTRWSATLGALGLFYGVVGVAWLGVWIDAVLVAGAAVLLVQAHGLRERAVVAAAATVA